MMVAPHADTLAFESRLAAPGDVLIASCGAATPRLLRPYLASTSRTSRRDRTPREEPLMPIRKPKPTSPGLRFVSYPDFAEITRSEPEKSLTEGLKKSGGRNAHGRKTSRHRGGGAKRLYRRIDFKRLKDGIPAKVAHIEYDPNRSAYIALLHYADGEKRYIIAPARLQVGATVESGPSADIRVGNALPLANMPAGTVVHNVELHTRPRRPARALRRNRDPAAGQGR